MRRPNLAAPAQAPVALLAALLAACQPAATATQAPPAATLPGVAPQLLPLPSTQTRGLVAVTTGGDVDGKVQLTAVSNPFFQNNAAAYRLQAMPSNNALITLANLDEALYARDGQVVTGLSDASGAFKVTGAAPADHPFVVQALLARGHRLSALALGGASGVTLDEASSMVVETARWQLRDSGGTRSLTDLKTGVLADLNRLSESFVKADDFQSTDAVPTLPALQQGAGFVLRNLYVGAFGGQVDAAGTSDADRLSDLWAGLLGFRPLALTRAVGDGSPAIVLDEGLPATETSLFNPRDVVEASDGTLYVTEPAVGRIRCVPAADAPAFLASHDAMTAGHLYTVAGVANGPNTPEAFNAVYHDAEAASATNPDAAPGVYDDQAGAGFPLYYPGRLALGTDGGATSLTCTSQLARRVFFLPSADCTRYGRSFKANRLYTLVGTGAAPAAGDGPLGYQAGLSGPQALVRDDAGNLWIADASGLRVLRATDGKLLTVSVTMGGPAVSLAQCLDLKLHGGKLYLALADRQVVAAGTPPDVAALPGTMALDVVLGKADEAGFQAPGLGLPAYQDTALPVPAAQVRLTTPSAIAFDARGNLVVADAGRVRVLANGQVTLLAGGLATSYGVGDARLASLVGNAGLCAEPNGNMLVVDTTLDAVRRLWTARGY